MKFILQLKHWQVFFLIWGIPILFSVFTFSDPSLMFKLFPAMFLIFTVTLMGWIWAMVTELNELALPENRHDLRRFRAFFAVAFSIFLVFDLFVASVGHVEYPDHWSIVVIILTASALAMICIFHVMKIAGKVVATVELGRTPQKNEIKKSQGEIHGSFIGIWTLQPRLNKIIEKNS